MPEGRSLPLSNSDYFDPDWAFTDVDTTGLESTLVRDWYEKMVIVRKTEQKIAALVETGEAICPCHLAIGQEAVPVGLSHLLTPSDAVFGAHRSHAHFLALGGSIHQLFAEILGKSSGCSHGLGGSMHLTDRSIGFIGSVPIVGATIPIATGAGLQAKREGKGNVAVSYFGDGATEEGVFHESLNLSSVHDLPVVYVCENNLYSSHMYITQRQPELSTTRYAKAHGIDSAIVDGNDVAAVSKAAHELIDQARQTGRPGYLEAVTYRWLGHVGHRSDVDVGVKRTGDLEKWRKRDPIARLASTLEVSVTDEINDSVATAVDSALDLARLDPSPEGDLVQNTVYAR